MVCLSTRDRAETFSSSNDQLVAGKDVSDPDGSMIYIRFNFDDLSCTGGKLRREADLHPALRN